MTPPSRPAPPDIAAYELLDLPVALVDAQGRLQAINQAFVRFTGFADPTAWQGRRLDELLCGSASDPAQRLWMLKRFRTGEGFAPVDFSGCDARGQPLHAQIGLRFAADGHAVFTLQPAARTQALAADQRRLTELLDMAQDVGHIGVWERDVRSLEGRWDRHVWRFWGLDPREGALSFDTALQGVVPEDRAALAAEFKRSLQRCGSYVMRYRLRAADGRLRHVRSQWEVRAGADGMPERAIGVLMDDTEALQLAQSYGETHAQLRLAMELADIAIWRYDALRRRLYSNERGWALLARPAPEEGLAAGALLRLVEPEDRAELRARLRQARAQDGPVEFGVRMRRGDGQTRYLLARCIAQRADAGTQLGAYVGVAIDINERFEQSRRELALARRLEMATGAAGVAIWTLSLDSGEVHWDEQMRRLHGGAEAVVSPDLADYMARYLHPGDHAAASEALRSLLLRKSGLVDLDLRVVRPDGSERRVASRMTYESGPSGPTLCGVMLDVTERHAAEARLREAAERVTLATRGAGIGTWTLDAAGEHGWWDEQMFRLRGRAPEDRPVSRTEALTWLHPADRETVVTEMRAASAEDRASNHAFRVIWPDGSVHWLASRSVPMRDDAGRTARRIGINWDITDARAAAEAQDEIRLAQRESQAKSQFLARMSHELRTPLNAVLGFAQLLLADGPAQDEAVLRRRAEHIHAAGKHLLLLINDVLDLSSLESGERPLQRVAVPLRSLVQSVLPLVETLAAAMRVEIHCEALDSAVLGDPMRLRQVLINLLSNAIKYNRPGGWVRIEAETAAAEPHRVRFIVEDCGRGMTDEQLQQVFEPFNRLGRETEGIDGTGIGLAIVQASVQRMGGRIEVRSEAGAGSCFALVLDEAEMPAGTAPDSAFAPFATTQSPAAPSRRVLYIEDNPVNLLIVSELLSRRRDLHFDAAPDGLSGIQRARATQPALVLIDMQLPDIDGHEVLRRLRADPATAGIKCIALSANAMPDDIQRALDEGFDDYWTKPLDFRRFMAALDLLLAPAATAP
ncbi:PAS domain-containing protein [Aquincola sp. S2]|uniref:histidine kinase n=1 Tax=Pseudaquabacterium terrae TaxID=2732868 RepID=A0ABX2EHB6_9BURK|nr:PAS domain-containing protein [Aquabacterium terrae]NRF68014.1 PAS domain-containing protein [Aquabacterium terrae]